VSPLRTLHGMSLSLARRDIAIVPYMNFYGTTRQIANVSIANHLVGTKLHADDVRARGRIGRLGNRAAMAAVVITNSKLASRGTRTIDVRLWRPAALDFEGSATTR